MRGSWGNCWLLCWRVATAALPNSPFLTFNSSRSSLSCELNEMMVNDIDSRPDSLGSRVNNPYAHRHRRGSRSSILIATMLCDVLRLCC